MQFSSYMMGYAQKYKKLLRRRKLTRILYFVLMGLFLVGGFTGVIICCINESGSITPFMLMGYVAPIVMWVAFLIFLVAWKDKKRVALDREVESSTMTADEVMLVGDYAGVDLYDIALKKRKEELGLEVVPEGYVRDRILPTKKEI